MTNNTTVETGNTVTLHYKGTLDDGTEFDNSYERGEPIQVITGAGQLIQGFDEALTGMTAGETKTFTLSPEEAYGERDEDATTTLTRDAFPDEFEFTEGMTVPLSGPGGQPFIATITEVKDAEVVADLNHPMAGKNLTFEVEVLTVDTNETTTG